MTRVTWHANIRLSVEQACIQGSIAPGFLAIYSHDDREHGRVTDRLPKIVWADFLGVKESHNVVAEIAEASHTLTVTTNEPIIDQAGVSDWVYLVHSGTLSAIKYTMNGHEILLSEIKPGELVGELSILASTERSSAVVASSEATLIAIGAKDFQRHCTQHSVLAAAVMKQLAERLIRTSTVLSERISMSVPSRLYGELVRTGLSSSTDEEILIIDPVPSVTGLARKIHATREATSRAMSVLQSRGLIRRTDTMLEIVTPKQ